tara:strand:+ start:6263 stop:7828 length:1566 start_codon:yes stop_codon:yes gene_type:complete
MEIITGEFPLESGNINYSFQFAVKTGEAPWRLDFGVSSTSYPLFSSPVLNQVITGYPGGATCIDASNPNLLIGNSSGQQVATYRNGGLTTTMEANLYEQTNLITGFGPTGMSGLGYSLSFTDSMASVGSPFSPVNDLSGAGRVQVFTSIRSGSLGVTGTRGYSFMTALTGEQASGNFGKSVSSIRSTLIDFLGVGAPGENDKSGAMHIYNQNNLRPIQSIIPTGEQVENFGKSSAWASQLGLEFLCIGYDQGGSGRMDIYRQDSNLDEFFNYFQTITPPSGSQSGDMFAYNIQQWDGLLFVGGPKMNNSGAVLEYSYDDISATFINSQYINDPSGSSGDNFGKNAFFGNVNGAITSDKNSGLAYIYNRGGESDTWVNVSTVSGTENIISGSFGGDLNGSQVTTFYGPNLIIGSSSEPYTYMYGRAPSLESKEIKLSISGSGGKLFDPDGNFLYGYSSSESVRMSGNIFTGGSHNIFINDKICVSSIPRVTGAMNIVTLTNPSNLSYYNLQVFCDEINPLGY